jgi:phosphatidylglycerophosphate synthase
MRLFFLLGCAAIGAVAAYYGQPFVHRNGDIILIIVTVFSVFAGFLIAIIAIVGDPAMIPEGSWRVAEGGRDKMEQRLVSHIWLFVLYLITIALLFVGVILEKALTNHDVWKVWIERAYLFFGISSFLYTFALPKVLMDMQRARYDAEIERRRRLAGIDSSAKPHAGS